MKNTAQIREHMEVIGSDGQHVGTVDKVNGNKIVLTKSDPTSGGQHHSIALDRVDTIEQDKLRLNVTAEQARQQWQVSGNEAQGQASGGTNRGGSTR